MPRIRHVPHTLVAGLLAAAGLAAAAGPATAADPPLQALQVERTVDLDLPPGVVISPTKPAVKVAPDGEHLFFSVRVDGAPEQLAISDLDGRGYRCVTCAHLDRAQKARLFDDGTRAWFANTSGESANGNPLSGGTGDFQWSVLECAPSVYDCRTAKVLPVRFPRNSLAQGAQNREAKPDPFGEYVAWNEVRVEDGPRVSVGRLVREDERYVVRDTRVVNPQFRLSRDIGDWVSGGRWYEGAEFVDGNRYLKYQTTTTGLNYDTYLLDLQTGERRQMTTDLDYNEVARYPGDGRWAFYTSARGLDRMDVFTQIVRPSLIDGPAFGQLGRVALWNNRSCMNEGWLMDGRVGQRPDGYGGQPIVLEDDWRIDEWDWLPGGNRAVVTETRMPHQPEPKDPAQRTRIRIVSLPAVDAAPPLVSRHLHDTDYRRHTVPASEYHGMSGRQVLARRIPGPRGGSATVTFLGLYAAGTWSVRYDRYSEDGRTFLSGSEKIDVANPILLSRWEANLRLTGAQTGRLRGAITIGPQNRWWGTAESELDGRVLTGVPQQRDCPGVTQAALRARVIERTSAEQGRDQLRVAVDTQVPEDPHPRPVQGAPVRVPSAEPAAAGLRLEATTDASGEAVLVVPAGAGEDLRAEADGFRPSS
ncbi:MAG: hypothetical protein ACEQSX_11230 [Baekduiaceae bacterium]